MFERAQRTRNLFGWNLAKVPSFGSIHVALCWWLVPKRKLKFWRNLSLSRQDIEGLRLLTPKETLKKSPGLVQEGLLGALWSESEICVDPQEAIQKISLF